MEKLYAAHHGQEAEHRMIERYRSISSDTEVEVEVEEEVEEETDTDFFIMASAARGACRRALIRWMLAHRPPPFSRGSETLLFDFETFRKLVEQCYEPGAYTLKETLWVFLYYFWRYEQEFSRPHPNIRMRQIQRIMKIMPYLDNGELLPSVYGYIIEQHFQTKYRNCDYNINHFFSGRIRELRYHETC